jgi:Domain of unknown function (DUF4365)
MPPKTPYDAACRSESPIARFWASWARQRSKRSFSKPAFFTSSGGGSKRARTASSNCAIQRAAPLGKLLGVQVKSTDSGQYARENDNSFEYLLKPDDLKYWRTSNIPVIIVLWRKSDETAYWKDVSDCVRGEERRLKFDKRADVFDPRCADRFGALTIDRRTPGVFLPRSIRARTPSSTCGASSCRMRFSSQRRHLAASATLCPNWSSRAISGSTG